MTVNSWGCSVTPLQKAGIDFKSGTLLHAVLPPPPLLYPSTHPPTPVLSLTNKGHQNNLNGKGKRPNAAQLYFYWLCLCFCLPMEMSWKACLCPCTDRHTELWKQAGPNLFQISTQTSKSSYFCPAWCSLVGHVKLLSFGLESFYPGAICLLPSGNCTTKIAFKSNSVLFCSTANQTL